MKKTYLLLCLLLLIPIANAEDGDSMNVILLSSTNVSGDAIIINGDYAFVDYNIYDISNDNSPIYIDRINGISPNAYVIDGNYLYVANSELMIYDISNPEEPNYINEFNTQGTVCDMIIMDNNAYIADYNGFTILNIEDIQNISEETYIPIDAESVLEIEISTNYAYLVANGDFYIFNITSPSSPTQIGHCEYTGTARGLSVLDNYAFIGGGGNPAGLRIIDISDSSNPNEVNSILTLRSAFAVNVVGNFAYVASHFNGITILNISDPLDPIMVGYYDTPGYMMYLDVHDDIVYATGTDYFHIYDCSAATDDSPPDAFSLLTPSNNSTIADDEVELIWSESSDDVYKYVLYTATNSSFTQNVDSVDVEDTDYIFDELENNTTYWWKVRAQNANSTGRWSSQTWSFTIQQSDVGEHGQLPDEYAVTALYPNPFNPTLTAVVSLPMAVPLKVSVYNMLGKEVGLIANGVYPAGYQRFEFDGGSLSSGVYFLKAVVPGKLDHTEKVVLMK